MQLALSFGPYFTIKLVLTSKLIRILDNLTGRSFLLYDRDDVSLQRVLFVLDNLGALCASCLLTLTFHSADESVILSVICDIGERSHTLELASDPIGATYNDTLCPVEESHKVVTMSHGQRQQKRSMLPTNLDGLRGIPPAKDATVYSRDLHA